MTASYDQAGLGARLDSLPERHRAAFAAACTERQLENYAAFAAATGWGDLAALQHALDRVWAALAGRDTIERAESSELARMCESLGPTHSQRFNTRWKAAAAAAAASVAYCLRCLLDGSSQLAVWTARDAYEALAEYVIREERLDMNDSWIEQRIQEHPWIREELRHQDEDLSMLTGAASLGPHLLATLRERSRTGGLRPVSRGLADPPG